MKRLLKNHFELYSILACIITAFPLIIIAALLRSNYSFVFHFLLFLTGWLVWTWIEYHVHRFLLHPKTDKWKTRTSKVHQHHHVEPGQFEITLSHRILLFIFNCLFIYIAYRLNNYFTFLSGFFWGAGAYCYIHYLLHKKWTEVFMPRHHDFHITHHCKNTDKCFGVTVMWWDILFGTIPTKHLSVSNKILNFYYKK
jgi:sterol desaturase/sphingolipid hydroxylase (fatty acid hydroxylase superfamily)